MITAHDLKELERIGDERAEALAQPLPTDDLKVFIRRAHIPVDFQEPTHAEKEELRSAVVYLRGQVEFFQNLHRLRGQAVDGLVDLALATREMNTTAFQRINDLEKKVMELEGLLALAKMKTDGFEPGASLTPAQHNAFPGGRWGTHVVTP